MDNNKLQGIREIARLANVSIGTVDRVIHNRKGVSPNTHKKITAIIEELGYQPNKMASLLASKKKLTIAILIPKVSTETDYWLFPLNGIQQAAEEIKQFGVKIQYHFFDLDSKKSFTTAAGKMLKSQPSAILLAPSFVEESVSLMEKINQQEIPVIFINSDLPQMPGLTYIGPDLYQSGRLGAQLVSKCLKTDFPILVVNLYTNLEIDHHLIKKVQGFTSFLEEQGQNTTVKILNIDKTDHRKIEQELLKELKGKINYQGLFVTNSRVNIVADILIKHQLKPLLIGYDFLEKNIAHLVSGQIDFLIGQRPKEQGYMGIMMLYKYLYNISEPTGSTYMPIDIITKENYKYYYS